MYYGELLRASRLFVKAVCCVAFVFAAMAVGFYLTYGHIPHADIPMGAIFATGGVAASILATVLAGGLACENDGHLAVAWTKPASRLRYALAKTAVDAGAIAALFAFTTLVDYAFIAMNGDAHRLIYSSDFWPEAARFLLAPFAVYGLMQALTASLDRQAGMVIGFTWVALIVLLILASIPLPQPWHAIFTILNVVNPVVYFSVDASVNQTVVATVFDAGAAALALIAVFGTGTALLQWRRLEA